MGMFVGYDVVQQAWVETLRQRRPWWLGLAWEIDGQCEAFPGDGQYLRLRLSLRKRGAPAMTKVVDCLAPEGRYTEAAHVDVSPEVEEVYRMLAPLLGLCLGRAS